MKAMGGGGGSFSRSTQKAAPKQPVKVKKAPKQMSHSQLAAKWQEQGGKFVEPEKKQWTKSDIEHARAAKERAEAAAPVELVSAAAAAAESSPAPSGRKADDLARERMAALANRLALDASGSADASRPSPESFADAGAEELRAIVDCRRQQLEELEVLQAMYPEELLLLSPDAAEALRAALEAIGEEAEDEVALRSVAAHPPLDFVLQLSADDNRPAADDGEAADGEGAPARLVAAILLVVRFPPQYPTEAAPALRVEDAMITDANSVMGADKVLSTLAVLGEAELSAALLRQAEEARPGPAVYEVASWLLENAFSFVTHSWV